MSITTKGRIGNSGLSIFGAFWGKFGSGHLSQRQWRAQSLCSWSKPLVSTT
jgi:hypothetical protein